MDWLPKLISGLSFLPAIVNGVEGLFGKRSGEEKKNAALTFLEATLSLSEALSNSRIVDSDKFKDGLGKMIDGAVECLNASVWAKQESAAAK
jgi:hypothetical protein